MAKLTDVLKREHKAAEKCHICKESENRKARGHCHYTGLYHGAGHNNCNLDYRLTDYILLIFHHETITKGTGT